MSNTNGKTDNRLRDRPKLSNARAASHPAIATDQGADLHDARRAAGTGPAGGNAAKHRVPVSPGETSSRPKKAEHGVLTAAPRLLQGRTAKGEAQQSHRVRVADAYLTGDNTVAELAVEHGVSVFTIRDWIRDRRDTFMLDHRKRPLGTRRDRAHEPNLVVGVYGTGGTMTDESVRRATRDLEKAIVAGLAARGLAPLPYRREVAE